MEKPRFVASFVVFALTVFAFTAIFAAPVFSADKDFSLSARETAAEFLKALLIEADFQKAARLSAIPAMPTAVDLERNYREDFVSKFRDGLYKKIGRWEKRLFKTAIDESAFAEAAGFLWAALIFSDHVVGEEGDLRVFKWLATVKTEVKNGKVVRLLVDFDSLDSGCVVSDSAPASP